MTACLITEAQWSGNSPLVADPKADSILRGVLDSVNQMPQRQSLIPDLAFKSAATLLVCTGFI